jgi:hypothetical protein
MMTFIGFLAVASISFAAGWLLKTYGAKKTKELLQNEIEKLKEKMK